jgi:CubicO group peptidase (beta-lactamase class C family)
MNRPLHASPVLLALLLACGGDAPPGTGGGDPDPLWHPADPAVPDGWAASTAQAEGMDEGVLDDLSRRLHAGEYGAVTSILVVRNGRLVFEDYHGAARESAHTMQSVTKSVTSLLAGIAIDQGRLGGVDARVVDFFPDYRPIGNLDARKDAMRVEDLLTMRTGLDWSEAQYEGSPLQQLNDSRDDWLRLVLDWPMREPPGARWEYVSGGVIVLGGVVGRAAGEPLDRFAAEQLFEPLQARGYTWFRGQPDGLLHTGGGLSLRPRDMAKIGWLMVDGGRWQGRQVVSERWIAESTRRMVRDPRTFGPHRVDYGYLWWIGSLDDPMNPRRESGDVWIASGAMGQWIFAVPRYRLVMVATGQNGDGRWASPFDFLYTHVLAAVR